MSTNSKLRHEAKVRLDQIWEDEVELRMQRKEIENELCNVDFNLNNEMVNWAKAQHFALGKAMEALKRQENVINAVLVNPNVFDKADTADYLSDTAEVIEKLKKEDSDLTRKLDKVTVFLNDDNKTAKVSKEQIVLLERQECAMLEYHSILMNRIFDLQGHQK